ncbi:MAG: hypothetical protein FWE71_15150 [Nocardioidaceae bacterium]|nr:hypothetical protein [Nocardioidaceae bacterium]MCL2614311.1 hypothetical protein [Nocardioidaceae bacterium]
MANRSFPAPKVPEVFLLFWIIKLLTTGIGETASDFMGTTSLVLAGIVGVGGFFLMLWLQLRATTYHPVRYWTTVLMVAVFGTMIADGPHVALGSPYYVDAAVYFVLLVGLLWWWKSSEGTLSVHSITTARRERFYWATVLLTFGLGTALGDTTAANLHMGFLWSIVLFAVAILIPLGLWRLGASAVACFWASYSLTRPLGASAADYLAAHTSGGLALGTGPVTLAGLILFVAFVGYLWRTHGDEEGHHALAHAEAELDAVRSSDERPQAPAADVRPATDLR